jgi:hypothetical protein
MASLHVIARQFSVYARGIPATTAHNKTRVSQESKYRVIKQYPVLITPQFDTGPYDTIDRGFCTYRNDIQSDEGGLSPGVTAILSGSVPRFLQIVVARFHNQRTYVHLRTAKNACQRKMITVTLHRGAALPGIGLCRCYFLCYSSSP